MNMTIRAKLLVQLDELERKRAGEIVRKSPPVNRVRVGKFPTITRERWASIERAARDPSVKLRGQAIIAAD